MSNRKAFCRAVAGASFPLITAAFGSGTLLDNSMARATTTTLADWTFETSAPTTAGPFAPETGSGSALGFHAGTTTYSSPVGNGSTHSFSSNGWAVGDYLEFSTNGTGYTGMSIQFDQTGSNTGPSQFQLEYSTDNSNFTAFGSPYTLINNSWSSTTPKTGSSYSFDLSSITALNGTTDYFRLVDYSTVAITGGVVASGGTDRIDNVAINSTPAVFVGRNLNWNPPGTSWNASTSNTNWIDTSSSTLTYFTAGDEVNFTDAGVGTVNIDGGGISPSIVNVSNNSGTYTFTGGPINDNGASSTTLNKSNNGTLILTAPNGYSGNTTLTGGTLAIDNDDELGSDSGKLSINGATLQMNGVTLARSVTIGSSGAIINTSGGSTLGATGTSFGGTGNFTKTGVGNLNLVVVPSYTGTTSVLGGTLTLTVGTADVTITAPSTPGQFTGNLVFNSELSLDVDGGLIDGGGTLEAKVDGVWIFGSGTNTATTINNNIIVDTGSLGLTATFGNTMTVNGAISGYAGLRIVSGAGIVTLASPSNSYQNQTLITNTNSTGPTVAAGVLRLGVNNALPVTTDVVFGIPTTGTTPTAGKAGALDLNGYNQTVDSIGSSSLTDSSNNVTYAIANGITNSSSTTMSTLTIDDQGAGYFATYANSIGAFSTTDITGYNDIALTLASTNAGNLTLLGVSSYTGSTTINGGTLTLGTGGSIASSAVTIGAAGILDVNATSGATVGALNSTSPAAILYLDNSSVLTVIGGGTYAGLISASTGSVGGLAITGGTLKFTGATKSLGSLSITGGKLDLGNGNLIVNDTVTPAATIIGYIKSGYDKGAQDGTGIISSAALTQKGTALGYIDTGTQLKIKYTWYGDLDLSGTVTIADQAAMTAGNGTSWSQGDLNYDGVKNADDFSLFQLGAAMQNGSIPAGVPEPTTLGLVALPMLMGMRRRRR